MDAVTVSRLWVWESIMTKLKKKKIGWCKKFSLVHDDNVGKSGEE